jgi:hypothetical protein
LNARSSRRKFDSEPSWGRITYQIGIEYMAEELLLRPEPLLNAREQTVDIGTPVLPELLE